MNRLLTILCAALTAISASAGIHSYSEHSALREGRIVKVRVSETGIHCIPYDTLQAWGLNPQNVRVLGYGGVMLSENFQHAHWDDVPSLPFYMHTGTDGVFGSGDYILFYAQATVGWTYNGKRWKHTQNPYSRYGYYFISDAAGEQKIIGPAPAISADSTVDVDWFEDYRVYEKDSINLVDVSGVSGGGREFYDTPLHAQKPNQAVRFTMQNVLTDSSKPMRCFVDVAAYSGENSTFYITLANTTATAHTKAVAVSDFYTKAECDSVSFLAPATNNGTQTVNIRFQNPASGANGYLNYVELTAPCALTMQGNEMPVANTTYYRQPVHTRFLLSGAGSNTQVWRVTDGVNIAQMPTENIDGKLAWLSDNTAADKYIALNVNASAWKQPVRVGTIANQDLHALSNIDYVIITPEEFKTQATRLAQKHEQVDNITWAVVTDQQVYNEFSSGTPDVTAYRWLMKMLYDRAAGDKNKQPKNLLLFGNASFDNRNILRSSGTSKLLVYEAQNSTVETKAYACDDYCGFLADNAGIDSKGDFSDVRAQMNIGVGRLPVKTTTEAENVVNKLCKYMDNNTLGKWKTQLCFLADDGDHGLHVQTADGGAERVRRKNPDFVVNKIYLDAYTQEVSAAGESYPLAKNQFDNLLSNGVLLMDYSGHGGYNNITNELFMTLRDIQNMTNTNQGVWFLATCSFAHFDGGNSSAAEEAVLNPVGGAIGVVSACRTVYATQNAVINRNFCDTLFGHSDPFHYNMTLGQATATAKNMTGRDENKMAYVLIGDPAIRLHYPTQYQVQTTTRVDTLHALTVQTIEGYIQTPELDTATWFNGKLDITIFDKMQKITTRDNDETNETNKTKITYNDYPNTLFAGQTDIVDGKFSFTFMVPKDIRYNYGNGRIVYYAYDNDTREEGIGHFENFIIGGSSSVEIIDTIGPDIRVYLNNPAFADYGKTYELPHFYADIHDDNGINTVGSGIGHDLLLIIDQDPKMTYVLNDYFTAQNNSFQTGQVSYKMPEMTEGQHQLTFRAWDLLNNSNTATLNFQVVKGLDPNIYQVISYPNPVSCSETLNIRIEYDQPDEIIRTVINIYDLSGHLIASHEQDGTDGIAWNIAELGMSTGIYVYQVQINRQSTFGEATSNYVTKSGKIIVAQ